MRVRWRFTILWTGICLAAFAVLLDTAGRPPEPGCFEYCSLNADVAGGLIPIVFVGWLVIVLLANWLWTLAGTTRCPGCGRRNDRAVSSCPACSYDLAAGGQPMTSPIRRPRPADRAPRHATRHARYR